MARTLIEYRVASMRAKNSSSLQNGLDDQERYRPTEPAAHRKLLLERADLCRLQHRPHRAKRDECKRHDVAANHPLPVLLDEAAPDGDDCERRRHNPVTSQD